MNEFVFVLNKSLYPQFTHLVKLCGGPIMFIKTIESNAFQNGLVQGRMQMLPAVGGALALGGAAVYGCFKVAFKQKIKKKQQQLFENYAKNYLTEQMKTNEDGGEQQ